MLASASIVISFFSAGAMAAAIIDNEISCTAVPSTYSQLELYDETNPQDIQSEMLGLDPVLNANGHPILQRYNGNEWNFVSFLVLKPTILY